ncbi:MAG: elongation factor G [Dehalococcoidales bacterium]|nr:elongation factor G [Dehalococcoidales bacterium]
MPKYGLDKIHNTVLLSHGGAGKTSLAEAMLFSVGAVSRLGKVDDGSSTSDYEQDEIKRKISINLSLLPCEWRDTKLNILDAPGYTDFVGEVKAGMRVSEGAVVVVCAASGVEVGTELVWEYCEEAQLPRLIFVNKMDRENADFFKIVEEIRAKLGNKCLPLQLAVGAHTGFEGVVNLLDMKAYIGTQPKEADIPEALKAQADSYREKLVEAIAEIDDALIEKYLGGEEISPEELTRTLRQAVISGSIVPILTGSALQNVAVNRLMDAICDYLPVPREQKVAVSDGSTVDPGETSPLAALVFKTTADPYVGKLTYFRVYNGVIKSNSQVYNANQKAAERIGQLFMMRGKTQEPVNEVGAGDIGAVAKLNVTDTGDTLCVQDNPINLTSIVFPKPTFREAVYPKTKIDIDKMGTALSRLAEEDPTLTVHRELGTGETILSGMGDTHLAVAAEKMQKKFGVNVELATPKVPYRETITVPSKAEYKHRKQSGGHGQYGHVLLSMEPLPERGDNEFGDKIVGGSVPKNYIPAVEKGVNEAYQEGALAGYPVVGVKTTLYDGSFHPVDSSEICFKIAGAGAFKKGMDDGQPILLEPIMNLKVTVPNDLTGDIIGDLNTKRARVLGINPEGGNNVIDAQVPLAEIQRYAIDLKSMTQGRAVYNMEFDHYEEVPAQITQKIVAQKQSQKE